ncbi:MAG: hypothetical protein EOL87_10895 [Spartobacteria bacterium]|nr:hypothetical protein [Spartobacteria bacterium]
MLIKGTDLAGLDKQLEGLPVSDDRVLVFSAGERLLGQVDHIAQHIAASGHTAIGALFPGVIFGGRRYDNGLIMNRFPMIRSPFIFRDIENPDFSLLRECIEKSDGHLSALCFFDSFAPHILPFIESLRDVLDTKVPCFGAGAGSLDLVQRPCLWTGSEMIQDAAVVVLIPRKTCIGVNHGWKKLAGPFTVTKSSGHTLMELNGCKASKVYAETIKNLTGDDVLRAPRFYDLAMKYPVGFKRGISEYVVRDALAINGNHDIMFFGDVPEGFEVDILCGDYRQMVSAASHAARDCMTEAGSSAIASSFAAVCVSRMLYMGDYFERELDMLNQALLFGTNCPIPTGVLSIGELASYPSCKMEHLNKTVVLATVLDN